MEFLKGAKDFARNPLGIIALFISLIYGFASLLLDSSAEKLTVAERWPLIVFVVVFPVLVLITFYKLVTGHHGKLYAPADFKDDKSFLRTLSSEEQEEKLDKEVKESFEPSDVESQLPPVKENTTNTRNLKQKEWKDQQAEHRNFREELKEIEGSVIDNIAAELKVEAERNVGIGETEAKFDAFLQSQTGKFTFLEVKAFRGPHTPMMVLDRILYQAVLADRYFESSFKLIIAVVYYFEEEDLKRVEKMWRRRIEKCPVDIEVRFLPKSKVLNA